MPSEPMMPVAIDKPGVKSDALDAIFEAGTMMPNIPYKGGRVVTAQGVNAVAKAVKKGYVRLAFFIGGGGRVLGGSYDAKEVGPLILLPDSYSPGDTYYRSVAVHEAIHRAVDGAGYQGAFQITLYENEYIAHLGQACYVLRKKDNINRRAYKITCVTTAAPAARSLLDPNGGKVSSNDQKALMDAVKEVYGSDNYTISCNGWWKA